MRISAQAKILAEAMQTLLDADKGRAVICNDIEHLWEIAYQSTSTPRALICYLGETPRGDFSVAAALGRVDRQWVVALIRGTGFAATRGDGLTSNVQNARPFYEQVEDARDTIRCLRSISEEQPLDMRGIRPMEKLDDFMSGYLIEFSTANDWPVMSVEQPTLIFTNVEQSYTAECEGGLVGNSQTATVAQGQYSSAISQDEADAMALDAARATAEAALVCTFPELLVTLPQGSQVNGTTWNTIASDVDTLVTSYDTQKVLTLRLRGLYEAKVYSGGTVEDNWRVGGSPGASTFNIAKLEVSSPAQTYYLNDNAIQAGGVFALVWDFEETITVDAGATITLTADSVDSKQLGPNGQSVGGGAPTLPVSEPYLGQFYCVQITDAQDP